MSPSADASKVRLLLVDDHALFRGSLAHWLTEQGDFSVAGVAASVDEALRIVRSTAIDVVLLDPDLGNENGAAFLQRAADEHFRGRIIVLTGGITERQAAQMISGGARGIFLKHDPPELLAKCIRKVHAGELWIGQDWLQALLRQSAEGTEPTAATFTERERRVLNGVIEGRSNKEIASEIGVSETGIKSTMQQLFSKTDTRTRAQLVRTVLEKHRDLLA